MSTSRYKLLAYKISLIIICLKVFMAKKKAFFFYIAKLLFVVFQKKITSICYLNFSNK